MPRPWFSIGLLSFIAAIVLSVSSARAGYAEFRYVAPANYAPIAVLDKSTVTTISATPAPGSLPPEEVASLLHDIPQTSQVQDFDERSARSNRLANWLALEQLDVILTDDHRYAHYKHCAGKMNPLSGLPFARTVDEEFMAAIAMNLVLRNPHHAKLLKATMWAYPILERAVLGSVFHYWKAFRM